jgi:glycosyltransferase involved in cell wall biosynthesis
MVTSQYPPVGQGGLGTHVQALARELARDRPVHLFAPEGAADGQLGYSPQPGDPLDPAAAVRWGLALTGWVQGTPGAVIHAHNYEAGLPALVGKALTRAPIVVTVHLSAPERYGPLERELLAAADRIIFVSGSQAEEYRQRGGALPPATVIHNGVDSVFFAPDLNIPREPGRLLFAGRLTRQKGCHTAIYALRELLPRFPDLRLRIAGAGPWERAYRNLARRLGCQQHVEWLGWLDPDALREEYRRCAALLMPSLFEPFGLTALEAMACGTPVVATTVGGLHEFIRDDENGILVPPSDSERLGHEIDRLLRDPARVRRLGLAAATTANRMTWSRTATATLAVYDELPWTSTGPTESAAARRRAEAIVSAALASPEEPSAE